MFREMDDVFPVAIIVCHGFELGLDVFVCVKKVEQN